MEITSHRSGYGWRRTYAYQDSAVSTGPFVDSTLRSPTGKLLIVDFSK